MFTKNFFEIQRHDVKIVGAREIFQATAEPFECRCVRVRRLTHLALFYW